MAPGSPWSSADAAPHDDAVDEGHIRFAIAFDAGVERVLFAEVVERLIVVSGTPEIVERAQVSAGRESAPTLGGDDHARDRGVVFPLRELSGERTNHCQRDRIERLRPIERHDAGDAAALEQDLGLGGVVGRHVAAHR